MFLFIRREIYDVTLEEVDFPSEGVLNDPRMKLYTFTIKGNGFLWHQVCCLCSKKLNNSVDVDSMHDGSVIYGRTERRRPEHRRGDVRYTKIPQEAKVLSF